MKKTKINEGEVLKIRAKQAKILFGQGKISQEKAEESIVPFIDYLNVKAPEIAKKFGVKARKFSVIGFLR